jgi:hypothetical protein
MCLTKWDELVCDFFRDALIPLFLTLVRDAESRLPTKHYKKWDDPIPSLFIHSTKHTLRARVKVGDYCDPFLYVH